MKIINSFWLILIILSSCSFQEPIVFEKINNLKLNSISDEMIELSAEAYFYNPNNISGKLKSIDMQVRLNNSTLATITQQEHYKIAENARFTIPFTASFAMEDIQQGFFNNIMSIVTGKKLKFHFKGEFKVSTWGVTQTIPVDYYEEVKL
jgi:LEA14-like dessication related protein